MLVYSKLLNEKNIGDEKGLMEFCSSAKGSYGFEFEFLNFYNTFVYRTLRYLVYFFDVKIN